MMKKRSGLLIGLICALVLGLPYLFGWLGLLEYQGLDLLFKARGPRPVDPNIIVVEIDDRAINDFGRWPWPRGYHAEFLDILEKYKPKAIAFDILFTEPQAEHPEEDDKLAVEAKKLGNVFFASFFDLKSDKAAKGKNLIARKETLPLDKLIQNAKGYGFVNITVEPDGKVRKMPLFITYGGKTYPSLDLEAVSHYLGVDPFKLHAETDGRGFMWLNFAAGFDRFRRVSFSDIPISANQIDAGQKPNIDLNIFKDKIVLIGLTATGTEDYWSTSVSATYPGVGLRASSINTMLRKDFIIRVFPLEIFLLFLFLGAAFGTVVPRRTPFEGLIFFLTVVSGITISAALIFRFFNIWMDFSTMLVLCFVTYPAITLNQFIITRFEKGLIEKELQIASRIQQSILPQSLPQVEGVELGVKCVPAKHVGGDFYDFIKLIYDFVKLKEDRLGIVIGDVSGKGVPAALFMAKAMADFRGISHNYNEPNEALTAINERLVEEGVSGMFVTLQYLIYKPKEKKIKYSNGGHNPLVWVKSTGDVVALTQSVGSPVGIIPGSEFISDEFAVSPGDVFVMYTDGISEARDKNSKEFGEKRILDSALFSRRLTAQGMADKLVEEVVKFSEGMPQHDDMTVIVLKIL